VRIRSEHAVGYLKGRFSSLRGLRQQIDDPVDHQRALEWIRACIILHTYVIRRGLEDDDFVGELIAEGLEPGARDEEVLPPPEAARETRGQRKRRQVKERLFLEGNAELMLNEM
jgi:hypothetical protein